MSWFRVERSGAACTLVLVYMLTRLRKTVSEFRSVERDSAQHSGHNNPRSNNIQNREKDIDALHPALFRYPYTVPLSLHWLTSTPVQCCSLTSILAKSIRDHLVWHSHPLVLGLLECQCHCSALCLINLYIPIIFNVILMIQVKIPVKPSIGVHNAFRSTICITIGCIWDDSCYLVNS